MKIFKSFKTLLHICRTAPWPIMFKNMMCLVNKSLEDFLRLGFLGVINFNFLPLFNSLDKNCEFLKPYCTSIGQSLPYHKRWHSYCINCKWSSGNYLIFFLAKKTRQLLFPTFPDDKTKSDYRSCHPQTHSSKSFGFCKKCWRFFKPDLIKKSTSFSSH